MDRNSENGSVMERGEWETAVMKLPFAGNPWSDLSSVPVSRIPSLLLKTLDPSSLIAKLQLTAQLTLRRYGQDVALFIRRSERRRPAMTGDRNERLSRQRISLPFPPLLLDQTPATMSDDLPYPALQTGKPL